MCAGLDSAEMISQLRAAHAADSATASGVDVITGGVGDMSKLGIYESFRVSTQRGRLERRKNRVVPCASVSIVLHSMHLQRLFLLKVVSSLCWTLHACIATHKRCRLSSFNTVCSAIVMCCCTDS